MGESRDDMLSWLALSSYRTYSTACFAPLRHWWVRNASRTCRDVKHVPLWSSWLPWDGDASKTAILTAFGHMASCQQGARCSSTAVTSEISLELVRGLALCSPVKLD